jgi:hypothetical protein
MSNRKSNTMRLLTQYEVEQLRNANRYDGQPKKVSGKQGRLSSEKAEKGKALVVAMRPTPEAPTTGNVSTLQATIDAQAKQIADLTTENKRLKSRIAGLESPQSTIESPTMANEPTPNDSSSFSKADYQREYMRKKRAAAKAT